MFYQLKWEVKFVPSRQFAPAAVRFVSLLRLAFLPNLLRVRQSCCVFIRFVAFSSDLLRLTDLFDWDRFNALDKLVVDSLFFFV